MFNVIFKAYPKTGSTNYNYKGSHSIILMALCDANCNFTYVNIGMPGWSMDRGIFKTCELGKRLMKNELFFPEPSSINPTLGDILYFIVGDEAFRLKLVSSLMRP